jgi:nucleotide-binding universal stress UspA family protein
MRLRRGCKELRLPAISGRLPRNIVVGLDFSEISDCGLDYAIRVADGDSTLHLVHAVKPLSYTLTEPGPSPTYMDELVRGATERVQSIVPKLGKVPCRIWVRPGYAEEIIIAVVTAIGADLVVVGTHGSSGLKKLVTGSVAEGVFRKSPCPVLTVGPQTEWKQTLQHILYPTDLLSESYDALACAIGLAESRSAHLTLLHIVEALRPDSPNEYESIVSLYLGRLGKLIPSGVHFSYVPELRVELSFSPVDAILEVAAELAADLLVFEVRREEAWASHLPDNASKLISRARCPVVTSVERPHAEGQPFTSAVNSEE